VFDGNQAMTEHVNSSQTLLKHYVANQRLILTVRRFHIHKGYFVKDWAEAFYLNAHWPANFGCDGLLGSGLDFDFCYCLQLAEASLPRAG